MAHEKLWEKVAALDAAETALRGLCGYDERSGCYTVRFLATDYSVDPAERSITAVEGRQQGQERESVQGQGAGFLEQLCILAYLLGGSDVPLAGRLVKAESLESGQFFFRGHHSMPTEKLRAAFEGEPELLIKAGETLNSSQRDFGDAAIEVLVLPRFPVMFVVWAADEEFPGRASILFDETADRQLALDAILAAVELTVKALIAAVAGKKSGSGNKFRYGDKSGSGEESG